MSYLSLSQLVLARALLATALLLGFFWSSEAGAQMIIKRGSMSHDYKLEIEPRGAFAPYAPPGGWAAVGLGGGVNFGINVAPTGFLPTVNDSVAITLGIDTLHYFGGGAVTSGCAQWRGSGDSAICVRSRRGGGPETVFFTPVTMQWNFYLTPKWSVFGEPGLAMLFRTARHSGFRVGATPTFFVGGRFHFSKDATLTMRIGYPYTTIGVSFFL